MKNYFETILNQTPEFRNHIREYGYLKKVKSVQVSEHAPYFNSNCYTLFFNSDGNLTKIEDNNIPSENKTKESYDIFFNTSAHCVTSKIKLDQHLHLEREWIYNENGLPHQFKESEVKITKTEGIGGGMFGKHQETSVLKKHYICEYNNSGQIIKKTVKNFAVGMPDTVYLFFYAGKHLIKRETMIRNEIVGSFSFQFQPYEEGFVIIKDYSVYYFFDNNEILMKEIRESNINSDIVYEHDWDEYGNCTGFKITQGNIEQSIFQKFTYY